MSDETKLACGCHAEWTGERWQVAASSFLCDHNQGDPVDGAVPLPGQPDLLNVAKHHAPGVVHQYLVETVAALAAAEAEVKRLREARRLNERLARKVGGVIVEPMNIEPSSDPPTPGGPPSTAPLQHIRDDYKARAEAAESDAELQKERYVEAGKRQIAAEAELVEWKATVNVLMGERTATETEVARLAQGVTAQAEEARMLREAAMALYERVQMDESVGICLSERVTTLALGAALAKEDAS